MPRAWTLDDMQKQAYGRLSVVSKSSERGRGTRWICQCSCGGTVTVAAGELRRGNVQSCGCLHAEAICKPRRDLTSMRFGRWTVLSLAVSEPYKDPRYLCRCDCGIERDVPSRALFVGKSKSCGCLSRDIHGSMRGEKGANYKPSLTKEDRTKRRESPEYLDWARAIKDRAGFQCEICCQLSGELHSHHLASYHANPSLRTSMDNGVCLCETCHMEFHGIYGRFNNTPNQYYKFKESKNYVTA